jgi:hypothetical protein
VRSFARIRGFFPLDYNGQLMTTRASVVTPIDASTNAMLDERLSARPYDGMHFRAAVDAGAALGKTLAQGTSSRYIGTRRP